MYIVIVDVAEMSLSMKLLKIANNLHYCSSKVQRSTRIVLHAERVGYVLWPGSHAHRCNGVSDDSGRFLKIFNGLSEVHSQ